MPAHAAMQVPPPPGVAPAPPPPPFDAALHTAQAPKRTKRVLIGGLAALTAVSVAAGGFLITRGSGGDEIVDESIEVITDADRSNEAFSFAAATADITTARSVTVDMTMTMAGETTTMVMTVDRDTRRMLMDVDVSEMSSTEVGFDGSIEMIVDEGNGIAYFSGEGYEAFLGADAEWLSMDVAEFGDDASSIDDLMTDPLSITGWFEDLEPVDLGTEIIDGESLQHYQVTVDPATLAPGEAPDEVLDGTDALITFDVWVSQDNQIRRITYGVDELDDVVTIDMRIVTSPDPVEIALPDPSEVLNLDELLGAWGEEFEVDAETTED